MQDDKPVLMSIWYCVPDYTNRGCLNCGKRYGCNITRENLDEYFDSKNCMQHEPTAEGYKIEIYNEEEKVKILQFIKENGYGNI